MANQDDEIRGRALATSTLLHGLITALTAKGILTLDEKNQLYEIVLQNFEKADPNDPAVQVARKIIDEWAQIAATGKPPPPRA
ncbi:MAG TPA: hypothetical protein VME45_14375 [Stellaceae bacterium]|nr:hypothetical protein [Stellaceae bacterium]